MNVREAAIKAANEILASQGLDHFTLDAIADRAEITMVELTSEFPTRDSLMEAVADFHITAWEVNVQEYVDQGMSFPEAYIESMFCSAWPELGVFTAMISAMLSDRKMMAMFQPRFESFERRLRESGLRPGVAEVIMLVADGIVLNRALAMDRVGEFAAERIKAQLLRAIRPTEEEMLFGMFSHAMEQEAARGDR